MKRRTEHLTVIRRFDDRLQAWCEEHRGIGLVQSHTRHGLNAVITEARAHDDVAHGVLRSDGAYRSSPYLTGAR